MRRISGVVQWTQCCTLWVEGSFDGKTSVLIASISWKPRASNR